MSYLIDMSLGNGKGTRWTISHCQKCSSSGRDPNRHDPDASTCAKCPQLWPFCDSFAQAWTFYIALGPIDPNPRYPYPSLITGHHATMIIADDPFSESKPELKPSGIDWFALNKEFSSQ